MLTLNKNSWHYKLHSFISPDGVSKYENNLCPYFWLTIFYMLVFPFAFPVKRVRQAAAINDPVQAGRATNLVKSIFLFVFAILAITGVIALVIGLFLLPWKELLLVVLGCAIITIAINVLAPPCQWICDFVMGKFCPRIRWK